jgi:hypothetical protein
MKKTLIAFCCAASVHSFAQITINSNHLPNSGDLLFTREANLLTDFDLDATGPNYTWNFGDDVIQPGALDAGTECVDMGSLSLVDQLFFNNPLFPEYNSDFGIGAAMLSDLPIPIEIENAYQIYKNSGNVYAMTGIVATIEGVPLNAQYDDRDIIYDLPLTYNSSGNSHSVLQLDVPTIAYYGTDQYRDYQCDGWGTLNLYGQSFDVLRVKSTVTGFDSIFVSVLPFGGIQFPKDITTYQWLSTEFKVPVLEITSTESPFLGTQITARTADLGVGIEEAVSNSLSVFPNPTSGEIILSEGNSSDYYVILNSSGQKVKEGSLLHKRIDTLSLASGLYFIRLEQDGITQQTRFVKQ